MSCAISKPKAQAAPSYIPSGLFVPSLTPCVALLTRGRTGRVRGEMVKKKEEKDKQRVVRAKNETGGNNMKREERGRKPSQHF